MDFRRDIELQNTRAAVRHGLGAEPIDALRVLNAVSPRTWHIRIEFDRSNRNHLHIGSTPPLSDTEILRILDGRLPSLYRGDSLAVRLTDGVFVCDFLDAPGDGRSTSYAFTRRTQEEVGGALKVIGFEGPPIMHRQAQLTEWLLANTWLGSSSFAAGQGRVEVDVFGFRYDVARPRNDTGTDPCPSFGVRTPLKDRSGALLGEMSLRMSPRLSKRKENSLRHRTYGVINPEVCWPQFIGQLAPARESWLSIEVDVKCMEWYTAYGPADTALLRTLLMAIADATTAVASGRDYGEYLTLSAAWRRSAAAQRIADRQEGLRYSRMVRVNSIPLMREPCSENELVALYMKLEAQGALPFDCKVLEYTAQSDIDALADFRFGTEEAYNRFAPVEFEFGAAAFLDHDHPPQQTKLVICWHEADLCEDDGFVATPDPWRFKLVCDSYEVPVVVLRYVPAVEIR